MACARCHEMEQSHIGASPQTCTLSSRPQLAGGPNLGVGPRPYLWAGRDDTDGRVSDAVSVSWKRDNGQYQVPARAGLIQPAGDPGRVVVLAPQTTSASRRRSWTGPSHSRSRSTLAGSGSAAALSRLSSSLSSGVSRPPSTPPPNTWRRTPIPSNLSSGPPATVTRPQTEVEPAAEDLPLSEALSPAETRVLRYLPSLLSLREIGDELYLSVNTIKVHVRHIYAKLEVHSRRGAVERARAVGLL
jgi:DNA-binding CsgD family transcriptional regulator